MNVTDSNYDALLSKKIKEKQHQVALELVEKLSDE